MLQKPSVFTYSAGCIRARFLKIFLLLVSFSINVSISYPALLLYKNIIYITWLLFPEIQHGLEGYGFRWEFSGYRMQQRYSAPLLCESETGIETASLSSLSVTLRILTERMKLNWGNMYSINTRSGLVVREIGENRYIRSYYEIGLK